MNQEKIKAMRQGGKLLGQILKTVLKSAQPGVSLKTLDNQAEKLMRLTGGEPGFKLVSGYNWATCINLNDGIVHGIPHKNILLKKGDLVSLDMGLYLNGFHTDTSYSKTIGKPTASQEKFLKTGKLALKRAIAQAKPGNHIGHISQAMQTTVEKAGYSCVRNLTGHGIGRNLHQPPAVPCVLKGDIPNTPRLEPGLTIAIEVIYCMGKADTTKLDDNWTIATKDSSLSAMFEHTVLITKKSPQILT